jgi:hypothetical protein
VFTRISDQGSLGATTTGSRQPGDAEEQLIAAFLPTVRDLHTCQGLVHLSCLCEIGEVVESTRVVDDPGTARVVSG